MDQQQGYSHAVAAICRLCSTLRVEFKPDNASSVGSVAYPCGSLDVDSTSCGGTMVPISLAATDRVLAALVGRLAIVPAEESE